MARRIPSGDTFYSENLTTYCREIVNIWVKSSFSNNGRGRYGFDTIYISDKTVIYIITWTMGYYE